MNHDHQPCLMGSWLALKLEATLLSARPPENGSCAELRNQVSLLQTQTPSMASRSYRKLHTLYDFIRFCLHKSSIPAESCTPRPRSSKKDLGISRVSSSTTVRRLDNFCSSSFMVELVPAPITAQQEMVYIYIY